MKIKSGLVAVAISMVTSTSYAAELSVVGSWSGLPLHKLYEKPFWDEKMPEASDGKITASLTTHDQMGIKGGDVFIKMFSMPRFWALHPTRLKWFSVTLRLHHWKI